MGTRTIEHGLRKVVLEYDDSKAETDYEKGLVRDYLLMHDRVLELNLEKGKLLYDYGELRYDVAEAVKQLEPVEKMHKSFLEEAAVLTAKKNSRKALKDLMERMQAFNEEVVTPFHEAVVMELDKKSKALYDRFIEFEERDEKFEEDWEFYRNETCDQLYNDYDNYSLDMAVYDDDEQAFLEFCDFRKFYDEQDKIVKAYNDFIHRLSVSYNHFKDVQGLINEYFDDGGLLDSSISDSYANGTGDPAGKPVYIIPPGDKMLEDFRLQYGLLADSDKKMLTISVPMEVVEEKDVSMLMELVMALQHFPKMIEKWIFSIDIEFLNRDGIAMKEDDWKGHKVPALWFHELMNLPCMLFFIEDHDARAYILLGDLDLPMDEEKGGVTVEGENLRIIYARLFNACWFFMVYCHNTGFDPEPYIEAVLADYGLPITIEMVREEYEKQVKGGIQLKAVKKE